jgi:Fur family ferric uptake transcriptional regulator
VDVARADRLTVGGLRQDVRAAGLRATGTRLLVLRFLREHGGHHSADQVTLALAAVGEPMLRGSVYNVLGSLVDVGLVAVAAAGPGPALYEASIGWHHHFVCRGCGSVLDIPCVVGASPCLDAALPGAEIDEAQVIFRGRCAGCTVGADRGSQGGPSGSPPPRPARSARPTR